ncbi:unnamed protein product [Caenorhabditis sp. 36 PRJEB53466]|nr:unnamed protein product [Caenorhabditis sp. 36 PRJEB53466]
MSQKPPPSGLTSSQSSSSKKDKEQSDVPFAREIVLPEKHPRVRWHSKLSVGVSRNLLEVGMFLLLLAVFFLMGPSLISYMYPDIVLPFAPKLEWKCSPLQKYQSIDTANIVLETNLMATSPLKIQIIMKPKSTNKFASFEDLEKILLVVDDCGFDEHDDNVILCRPFSNFGPRPTFKEYVSMAETCYHYIRQITRKAKIIGYGRGIAANVLLSAAANLRNDNCFTFSNLYLDNPIPNIRAEFDKSGWINLAYLISGFREKFINDAISEHGYHLADLEKNVKRVGKTPITIITDKNYQTMYGNLKGKVKQGTIGDVGNEMMRQLQAPPSFFRHETEENCARKLNKTVLPLISM